MDNQLRREQEADYQRALAADRARVQERKRLESEQIENQKREEELRRQEEQHLANWERKRQEVLESLPNEPDSNANNIVRVALRFPDGAKLERRFNADDSLEVCAFFRQINTFMIVLASIQHSFFKSKLPKRLFIIVKLSTQRAPMCTGMVSSI